MLDPKPVIREIFEFLLSSDISGTVVEKRIDDFVAQGGSKTYKLKADPRSNLSRNRFMYTDE